MTDQLKLLENDLAQLIHKHSWVDGRTWQKVTHDMARAMFEEKDLDKPLVAALKTME